MEGEGRDLDPWRLGALGGASKLSRGRAIGLAISRGKRSEHRNCVPRSTIGMNEVSGPIQALSQGAANPRRGLRNPANVGCHRTNPCRALCGRSEAG